MKRSTGGRLVNSTERRRMRYWLDVEPLDTDGSGRSRTRLRRFGLVMSAMLALVFGYLFWRGHTVAPWVGGLGVAFLVAALVAPRSLGPVERFWLAVGEVLGAVVTRVILTLAFYLIITPVGLALRVFSGETLGKRPDASLESYWVPVEADGPGSRPDKPF